MHGNLRFAARKMFVENLMERRFAGESTHVAPVTFCLSL
jgi:hypothetical protein